RRTARNTSEDSARLSETDRNPAKASAIRVPDRSALLQRGSGPCARNSSSSVLVLMARLPWIQASAIAPRVESTEYTERVLRCAWDRRAGRAPGRCRAGGARLAVRTPPAAFSLLEGRTH